MDEPTLRLVEAAVASQAPASAPHPLRDELFPQLDRSRTLEDVEKVIHSAGQSLAWLGAALLVDPEREQLLRDAMANIVPQMLTVQDELEQTLRAAVGSVAARKAIVAQETLRRFFAICAREAPSAAKPSIDFIRSVALRLALIVVVIEHLVARDHSLVAPLADKAFETSQTLRRAAQGLGIDLTPWADAPAATRLKRIMEAARGFWGALDDDQRRIVGEAWGERVELPPQWPLPSS